MALALEPAEYRRLLALLDQALDLDAQGQQDLLASLECEGDSLRPHLERLLAGGADDDAARRIEAGPGQFLDSSQGVHAAGQRIGDFLLERQLGRGGMGDVWLARFQAAPDQPPVALKLPGTAHLPPGTLARLVREAGILTTLNHPNIARTIRSGVTLEGIPFLAMEFVDGQDLLHHCDQLNLDVPGRLRIFLQVLAAVAHAHACLILHRDLKPGNILVNAAGEAKLLDFGIAKLLDEQGHARSTELTRLAGRAMTPDYASPEQIAGKPLTVASDVYSLGVILYELLTGERPYRLRRGSAAELEEAILTAEPRRPSQTTRPASRATTLQPAGRRSIPGDLDTLTLKCLKKDPAARYATVPELQADLLRYLEGRPVLAQPDSAAYRLRKFVSRNWLPLAVGAAVSTSLLVGSGIALIQAREARAQSDRALAEASRANQALAAAQLAETRARAELERADEQTRIALAERLRAETERKRAEARFEDVRSLAHSLIFDVHDSVQYLPGATEARALIVDRGTRYLDKLSRESSGDVRLAVQLAEGYEKLGWSMNGSMAANQGDARQADAYFTRALALLEGCAIGPAASQDCTIAFARISLSHSLNLQEQGRLTEAARLVATGHTLRRQLLDRQPKDQERNRDMAVADAYLANLEIEQGRLDLALASNLRSLARFEDMIQRDARNVRNRWGLVSTHGNVGNTYKLAGQPDRAREHLEKSLALNRELEPDRPNHYSVLTQYGWMHYLLGEISLAQQDPEGAIARFEVAYRYRRELSEKDAKDNEAALNLARVEAALAEALMKAGRTSRAVELRDSAITRSRALLDARPNSRRVQTHWVSVVSVTAGVPRQDTEDAPDCRWVPEAKKMLEDLKIRFRDFNSLRKLDPPICPSR